MSHPSVRGSPRLGPAGKGVAATMHVLKEIAPGAATPRATTSGLLSQRLRGSLARARTHQGARRSARAPTREAGTARSLASRRTGGGRGAERKRGGSGERRSSRNRRRAPRQPGPPAGLDRPGCELGQPVLEQRAGDVAGAAQRPAAVLAELTNRRTPRRFQRIVESARPPPSRHLTQRLISARSQCWSQNRNDSLAGPSASWVSMPSRSTRHSSRSRPPYLEPSMSLERDKRCPSLTTCPTVGAAQRARARSGRTGPPSSDCTAPKSPSGWKANVAPAASCLAAAPRWGYGAIDPCYPRRFERPWKSGGSRRE
jgi:hypothetical protein